MGAVTQDGTLWVSIECDWPWRGKLVFDIPRHREYLHLPVDYPRLNQFPEWFTVEKDRKYRVSIEGKDPVVMNGDALREGLDLAILTKEPFHVQIAPVSP